MLGSVEKAGIVELRVSGATHTEVVDSIHVHTGDLHVAGPLSLRIEGARVFLSAPLMPIAFRGRGKPLPLPLEIEAVLRDDQLVGVARINQRVPGSLAASNFIGKVALKRRRES